MKKDLKTYILLSPTGITIEDIEEYMSDGFFLTTLEKNKAIFVKNPQWKTKK